MVAILVLLFLKFKDIEIKFVFIQPMNGLYIISLYYTQMEYLEYTPSHTLPSFSIFIQKIFTMAIVGNLFFITCLVFAIIIDKYISKPYDKKKSKIRNYCNLFLTITFVLISNYVVRQIFRKIPMLKISKDFKPHLVKETRGSILVGFAYLLVLKNDLLSHIHHFNYFNH